MSLFSCHEGNRLGAVLGFRGFVLGFSLLLFSHTAPAQSGSANPPSRWQAKYTQVYSDDFEGSHPGLQLENFNCPSANCSAVTSDSSLVIAGRSSVRMNNSGQMATAPAVVPLLGNTTYIVQFQYHLLNYGSTGDPVYVWMNPAGVPYSAQLVVHAPSLLANAPASGTFSAGAQTAGAASYILNISTNAGADIVIDNLTVFRPDATQTSTQPPNWSKLANLPYPRIGHYFATGSTDTNAGAAVYLGSPYLYSVDQIDRLLAFTDLIIGFDKDSQTRFADSLLRLRQSNPNVVIMPHRFAEEESTWDARPLQGSDVGLSYQFHQGLPDSWYQKDSKGNIIIEQDYADLLFMNVSPDCPMVNGQTFLSYLVNWLNTSVFPSGVWDGITFDNLFGSTNGHVPNLNDPALFDYDFNRNGIRDETPAAVNDMTRTAAAGMLRQLRNANGDMQLIIGNAGNIPVLGFAPYVNGYLFEGADTEWWGSGQSTMGWRTEFDAYRTMMATARLPRFSLFEAFSAQALNRSGPVYTLPTAGDIQAHRFAMGTALLSDGFYGYYLFQGNPAPVWFDEFSVDSSGTAVEDPTKKGYLGQALSDAVELADAGFPILQEMFEAAALPASFTANSGSSGTVYVSQTADDVISGSGSLVLSNPDHTQKGTVRASTNPKVVPLTPSSTYLLTFDWRILETLDNVFGASFSTNPDNPYEFATLPGSVAGDHGTASFPYTIPSDSNHGQWLISFYITNGGGKVAIDNVRVTQGGVGPWRRDFENGFVLVNPFRQPHTFSVADLAGALKRTGIHRIKGTQAPDANNGQPVTDSLTLGPFDAIILLANHIGAPGIAPNPRPSIKPNGVIGASAFGAFSTISPGSWIEIYGSNLSTTTRGWYGGDFNGTSAPTSLDGVSVMVGGRPAFVAYVSPGQVNALVASDTALGPMQVVVSGPAGVSDPCLITVQPTQPGLLAPAAFQINARQYVGALFPDGQTWVMPSGAIPGVASRPAKPGETVTIYGVGFGPVTPNWRAGTLAGTANSLSHPLQILFGTAPAAVPYYGLAPSYTGLYQFNIVVPDVPDGIAVPLTLNLGGVAGTQSLYIAVQR